MLPSEQAVPLPAHIGMEAAACLGIPAYTAYQAVLLTGVEDGSTVRIAVWAEPMTFLRTYANGTVGVGRCQPGGLMDFDK